MIYIYDILLNWGDLKKYEFFEWEDNDEIEYIKKIPIFRINNFEDVFNNKIKVKKEFLNKIYNKSEVYGNKKIEKIEYSCIFCNRELNKVVAIEFDEEGESIYKSNIYFCDLEDVFNLSNKLKSFNLDYELIYIFDVDDRYLTRNELIKKKYLINEIMFSYKENNLDKLKYIYFEMFGKESEDIDFIKEELFRSLENEYNYKHDIIYNLIKIPNFL